MDVKVTEENDFKYWESIINNESVSYIGGNDFKKDRRGVIGTFLFLPVWNLFELLNAWPYINPNVTKDDIDKRFQKVGGIPRHIFTSTVSFQNTLDDQEVTVTNLSETPLQQVIFGYVASAQTFDILVYEYSDSNCERLKAAVSSSRVARLLVGSSRNGVANYDARGVPSRDR